MRRVSIVFAVGAAIIVFAVPAASQAGGGPIGGGRWPQRLSDALDEIAFALDHERDARDALDDAGARADDYAGGETEDAIDHLNQALDDLQAAVGAGEISAAEATAIGRLIREARGHDGDALDSIDDEDPVRTTIGDLDDAIEDKEDAGDWIYYGDDYDWGELGCTLNVSPFFNDILVGYDVCKVAVAVLVLQFGFQFTRYTNGFVGEGNAQVAQFACAVVVWMLTCRPPVPLVPPNQYIFAGVGPKSMVMTDNWALAVGTNGKTQRTRFRVGTVQATDLSLRTTLRDVTPYGFVATDGSAAAPRLGAGIGYVYQTKVENRGLGTALDTVVDIDVPGGFMTRRLYPSSCSRSGVKVRCSLGALEGGYAGLVSVWGETGTTGAGTFRSVVSSGATEPNPDPSANSSTTPVKTYGVPRTPITGVARQVARGRPGSISGRALPGATFEAPLERVTKVEIGLLRTSARAANATKKRCLWLNNAGGFTKVPVHRGGCDKGIWLAARGTASWKYALKKGLPKGRYQLYVRGTNAAGITTRTFSGKLKNAATFAVK